jgi:hypothetical protein
MNFLPLLGKRLKDDDIIELLEYSDAEVSYDFDRLHENMPDQYWAKCEKQGIALGFDENQILVTTFLYLRRQGEYNAVSATELSDVRIFSSVAEIEANCAENGLPCRKGDVRDKNKVWALIEGSHVQIHYEFTDGHLSLVTLMLKR